MVHTFSNPSEVITSATAQKIKRLIPEISVSEARVAQFILLNLDEISFETGASIAEKASVSQITVSRFLKRAGYRGISALKNEMKKENMDRDGGVEDKTPINRFYRDHLENDMQAMMRLYYQFDSPSWTQLVDTVYRAKKVYVTGFQTIRGTAEDVSRKLLFARSHVQYLSPHDGMLAEWFGIDEQPKKKKSYDVLIVLDIVPYASESKKLCAEAKKRNMEVVVITDEFCYWAEEYTPHAFYTKSKAGLFLESTWGIVLATNMLVHCVADRNPDSALRVKRWSSISKHMNLF
ncbi:MurR/RpiR family transcriptional regulator [Psychromonas sp. PT13]|uniref:MurR/RpiR family transcriptional regulator n=1 Tax=Psychromonas sp. PT13 TaxID=3439547 RepID=UPI003EB7811C